MPAVLLAAALTVTTPEEAVVLLAADAPPPSKEVFEAAKGLIETAAKQDPASARPCYEVVTMSIPNHG